MFSPAQSVRIKGAAGEPLPKVFRTLEFDFLRGQEVLICAAPGVGKSVIALNLAAGIKRPALYFSADSDHYTQGHRLTSLLTGRSTSITKQEVRQGRVDPALAKLPIEFVFDPQPTPDVIEDNTNAFVQKHGEPPHLLVVDNITDVDNDGETDLNPLLGYLNGIARYTGACILGLHHVTGPFNDGDKPPPLSAVKDQIGRVPQGILTLFKETPTTFGLATVKNRGWLADPSAGTITRLRFDGDIMRVSDY